MKISREDFDLRPGVKFFIVDDDDMTDLAEAIMEDCDGEVGHKNISS